MTTQFRVLARYIDAIKPTATPFDDGSGIDLD